MHDQNRTRRRHSPGGGGYKSVSGGFSRFQRTPVDAHLPFYYDPRLQTRVSCLNHLLVFSADTASIWASRSWAAVCALRIPPLFEIPVRNVCGLLIC